FSVKCLVFDDSRLRALSSGGSITSPPLSPALPKYKLADYRYGREEMLALFLKDNKIPSDLLDKEFLPILQEEPLPPLALVPFTEEEQQRNFSMSVNSAAVLRLTGRGGGGTVVGAPRGRSSSRGRGRGRGECGFYQRSFDEVEGVFGRGGGREMHRSQSWEERGDRRFEKPGRKDVGRPNFEEGGPTSVGRKHEFIRSESENWRIFREEQNGEDEDGGWRLAGSRRDGERWRPHSPDNGLCSAGWREHMERRRRFEFDFRDRDDERGYRRVRSGSGSIDDDRDSLPEWCLEDAEEEMGTFDSSGAFLSLKKVQKEPIPEEQEMDFRPVEEGEECSDSEEVSEEAPQTSSSCARPGTPSDHQPQETPQFERKEEPKTEQTEKAEEPLPANQGKEEGGVEVETPVVGAPGMGSVSTEPDDEEGLKHLEQQAEKMVAYLQDSALDDEKLASKLQEHRAKGVSVPLIHEAMQKWYYKDPQGEVQGPFNNQEMAEWFQAGYFTMSLLVKRACDESFQPLGDIMKMWGRVPFSPGPAPPPHLGELDQERLSRQQELTALYQMQHLQYQQFLIQVLVKRQQYAQVLAQQQKAALSSQQQQQLALLLQALKMSRISDQNIISSVTRSVTVPDNGSIWELQPTASQPTVWEGGSVWDLPLDTTTPGPALEQLQQMEKAKAAKERREAEMRAKREEEERKRQEELRRQQEELLRRQQEEERKRREEEELARRKQQTVRKKRLLRDVLQKKQAVSVPSPPLTDTEDPIGWGNVSKPAGTTKSLLEIQQEEVRQSRARNSAHSNLHTSIGNSVWGSINTGPPNQWASDLVSSIWSNADTKNSNMGFWDDAVKEGGVQGRELAIYSLRSSPLCSLSVSHLGPASSKHKKVEEEEKLLKLFQGVNKVQDGFTQWCEQMLHALNTANNLDVPTFVSFLKEVESPYEVHDYIRAYLGDTSEAKEFAKQFLERRAKQKATPQIPGQGLREMSHMKDPVWGVNHSTLHSVFQTNQSNNQQSNFEAVQSGKKKKKQKMVRADPSLLGFSVNASSERLNMGEIETLDDY
uniref:GRB10 interacting GYF protein 2 n=1 Tax=Loxodonta africana TaxID=9785 RepID=G3TXH4_LOXAF